MVAAVRWTNRGLRLVEGREEEAARRIRAQMLSALAGFRERQSRLREAELACRQAIAEGEAVGELRALAHACYVLDHVLVRAGRLDEATHSARALAIYRDLGDAERESAVLNNLGGFAYERGDWDEAIELYRRQAEASERAGNPADLAFTDVNLGEILSDQGYLERADEHLRRGRRVWSSTEDALMRAFADAQLGRLAMRAGRYAESVITLRETAERMRQLGAGGYADLAEAFLAEAEAFGGDPAEALLVTDGLLRNPAGETPLIRRVRGIAYARLGLLESAASEFETSLRLGSELSAHYDLAATLDAMARVLGVTAQQAAERDRIVARLRIAAMPTPMYESGVGNGAPHPVAAAAPLPAV
jgi:tetratricopeptide (TPR) repeat protein